MTDDPHRHGDHHAAEAATEPSHLHSHAHGHATDDEPPAEPGYPEPPELQHPAGDSAGSTEPHAGHGPHAGQGAHGAHADHGGHGGPGGHHGHDKHAGHSPDMFRSKFWLSLALTVPTVIWGHMLAELTGFHAPNYPVTQWIAPLIGTIVFVNG